MCMVVMGHWCTIAINSLPSDGRSSAKEIGHLLSEQIPQDAEVFNMTKDRNYSVMFYLDRNVSLFSESLNTETDQVPEEVYVIANEERPINLTNDTSYYKWTPLSEAILGDKGMYQAWKGVKQDQ